MAAAINDQNDSNSNKPIEPISTVTTAPEVADTQVKVRKKYSQRIFFSIEAKLRIMAAYDACEDSSSRGALLRKEGLYQSRIIAWRHQLAKRKINASTKQSATTRTDNLTREIESLKKQLAQAEAIIDIQKKVSALFTSHILPHENSEVKS
jgi:transposase